MEQAIEVNIGGIKCDNPECDYADMSVKVEDYKDWLNKPCPECGHNLLTQNDYDDVQKTLKLAKFLNSFMPAPQPGEEMAKMGFEMHGNGIEKINIERLGKKE